MSPLSPEALLEIFGYPVTNTLMATVLTDLVIICIIFLVTRKISLVPGRIQNVVEILIENLYDLTKSIAGERANAIFGWFFSFFFFIFTANILGLVPGFGDLKIRGIEGSLVPFFRVPTSDFNTTFALAVISLVATHAISIKFIGIKSYLGRFFSLSPILLFIGILELISEFTKLISFSFRLFGNIFAGEVVLAKISSLASVFMPIPFLVLEILVSFVQAIVFAMLTMVFMSMLSEPSDSGSDYSH